MNPWETAIRRAQPGHAPSMVPPAATWGAHTAGGTTYPRHRSTVDSRLEIARAHIHTIAQMREAASNANVFVMPPEDVVSTEGGPSCYSRENMTLFYKTDEVLQRACMAPPSALAKGLSGSRDDFAAAWGDVLRLSLCPISAAARLVPGVMTGAEMQLDVNVLRPEVRELEAKLDGMLHNDEEGALKVADLLVRSQRQRIQAMKAIVPSNISSAVKESIGCVGDLLADHTRDLQALHHDALELNSHLTAHVDREKALQDEFEVRHKEGEANLRKNHNVQMTVFEEVTKLFEGLMEVVAARGKDLAELIVRIDDERSRRSLAKQQFAQMQDHHSNLTALAQCERMVCGFLHSTMKVLMERPVPPPHTDALLPEYLSAMRFYQKYVDVASRLHNRRAARIEALRKSGDYLDQIRSLDGLNAELQVNWRQHEAMFQTTHDALQKYGVSFASV